MCITIIMYFVSEVSITCIALLLASIFEGITADLESKTVREGSSCRIVSPTPDNVAYDDGFIFSPKEYYVPIASKHNYYLQAEVFLNRSAKNENELQRLCRTVEENFEGFVLERGYENSVTQTCVPLPRRGQLNCTTTFASAGTNPVPFEKYIANILWSGNKTFVLMTRCTNKTMESYKLLTTSPDIEKTGTSFLEVRRNITRLGFNRMFAIAVGCQKCNRKESNDP